MLSENRYDPNQPGSSGERHTGGGMTIAKACGILAVFLMVAFAGEAAARHTSAGQW
jgi:hypothetical protein